MNAFPVAAVRYQKAVLVLEILAKLLDRPGVFFIPNIAGPLKEEQRQDVALPDTLFKWRTERDSNPRKVALHTLSKRADSAALAPLLGGQTQ